MKIKLFWEDFYDKMTELEMDEEYEQFEKNLVELFSREFGCPVEIEWVD
ncbi:MAG: hypothetical protein WC679_01195 [Bacteroidales bacterium]|jgi:hypothetical protein